MIYYYVDALPINSKVSNISIHAIFQIYKYFTKE